MPDLNLSPDYLARLIVKTRGLQAKEGVVDPQSGSNPIDDRIREVLQDSSGDLSREEIPKEIDGLDPRQQAELVALMWIGRADAETAEWEKTIRLAQGLKDGPTPRYLLRHPLEAEQWRRALKGSGSHCQWARRPHSAKQCGLRPRCR